MRGNSRFNEFPRPRCVWSGQARRCRGNFASTRRTEVGGIIFVCFLICFNTPVWGVFAIPPCGGVLCSDRARRGRGNSASTDRLFAPRSGESCSERTRIPPTRGYSSMSFRKPGLLLLIVLWRAKFLRNELCQYNPECTLSTPKCALELLFIDLCNCTLCGFQYVLSVAGSFC